MSESKYKNFNHLKIHSQYSICEGAIKIDELKDKAKEFRIKTLGLCDTSNLCGAIEFSENSRAPHKFDVSDIAKDLISFSLAKSFRSSILIAPSHIEYCECIFN